MADVQVQSLIDYAIAGEPASFKATLDNILLDKIGSLVDQTRDDMANSALKTRNAENAA